VATLAAKSNRKRESKGKRERERELREENGRTLLLVSLVAPRWRRKIAGFDPDVRIPLSSPPSPPPPSIFRFMQMFFFSKGVKRFGLMNEHVNEG
jgi:hypothetical protein